MATTAPAQGHQERRVDMRTEQPDAASRIAPGSLSSKDRGWSGLSAEVHAHRKGIIPWRGAPSAIALCIDVHGNGALVTRRAPGVLDRTAARSGTVWLSPAGWQQGSVDIADDLPGIAHISLPLSQFASSKLGFAAEFAIDALPFDRAFDDPLLGEIARAIVAELHKETSVGSLLVESLACSIVARLIQNHVAQPAAAAVVFSRAGLDRRRLNRVLDYIDAHLEHELSLESMAAIACLSRHHFARAFRKAVGQPPHRYVSERRLARAKALLSRDELTLADIALALGFSSQANFTRAFRQATGLAPGQYRYAFGARRHDASAADVRRALMITS